MTDHMDMNDIHREHGIDALRDHMDRGRIYRPASDEPTSDDEQSKRKPEADQPKATKGAAKDSAADTPEDEQRSEAGEDGEHAQAETDGSHDENAAHGGRTADDADDRAGREKNAPRGDGLTFTALADWEGRHVPEREALVPGFIPLRNVAMLTGDGGTCKGIISLQLSIAVAATRGSWLNLQVSRGGPSFTSARRTRRMS